MPFNTTNSEGVDFSAVFYLNSATPEYPRPPFAVGTVMKGSDGTEYVYVSSTSAQAVGDVCRLSTGWAATGVNAADVGMFGLLVGVVPAAVSAAAGTVSAAFFWLQRAGICPAISVTTGVTANQQLYSMGTTGRLDASPATGDEAITGLVTTATAASNLAPGILNYPTVGATT